MLRMLIVDDEKIIRETIRDIIDWQSLGITVAGLCKNGLEAYDMILDEYPDIVLTDINMPGLSGLDLISRITQTGQDTEFVILSGYGDYTYTKEAMRLGIQHYLLKPCNETEIIEVMQQVKKQCAQKRLRKDQQQQDYLMLTQLHQSVVQNLLRESLSPKPNFAAIAHTYQRFLSFTNVGYEICCFTAAAAEALLPCESAFVAYHEAHAGAIPAYCVQADNQLYLAFEAYDYDYTPLDTAMAATCAQGVLYRRVSKTCLNELLPHIHCVVQSSQSVLVGFGEKRPLRFVETPAPPPPEQTNDCVGKVIAYVQEHIADPELSLKNISEHYLYMNVDYVSRKFLKTTGNKFSAFLANERIEKAKALLATRTLTVNEVADAVGCGNNPQYFSQLFKKITGITPTDYIKQIGA